MSISQFEAYIVGTYKKQKDRVNTAVSLFQLKFF